MTLKEMIHIELLRDLRDAKEKIPLLEVASLIHEVYKDDVEVLAKELLKYHE